MTKTRAMLTWLATVVGALMAAFGVFLAATDNDEWDAARLVATGVAIIAGSVIYRLAMDDPQARSDTAGHRRDGTLLHH